MSKREFLVTVDYEPDMFSGIENFTLPLQGDDAYQLSSPSKGSKLEELMNSSKVIIIRGVPDDALPFRTFGMQKTNGTLLPHQDTTYTDGREDPRRWNLFTNGNNIRENKKGFIVSREVVEKRTQQLRKEFIDKKGLDLETVKLQIESEISYPEIYLKEFLTGSLAITNPISYWTIATKLFRNRPLDVDIYGEKILGLLSQKEDFSWLSYDEPNLVVLFDNKDTYHGRLYGNPTESVVTRRWLTNPGYYQER